MANMQRENTGFVKEIQKVLLDDEDFLRSLLQKSLQNYLQVEFDAFIQADRYERSESRRGYRNGSYLRTVKTRVGAIELSVCRDREGQFHTELFRRYQRNEQAFVLTLIDMYINGVSTRKVKKVVEDLCGLNISKSLVSSLTKELDATIKRWRNRSLERSYPYLVVDARYEDVRVGGVVMSQAILIVVGISESGHREILSIDIGDSENEVIWTEVFKGLKERGLKGVRYVVSDDHKGLVKALKRQFQGVAWQRCQVHFIRNFISKLSRKDVRRYIIRLKDIFSAPDVESARERKEMLVRDLEVKKPELAEWLDREIEYCFTVYSLPEEHRRRMRSTNMLERFNQELLRRSRVIRIFPNKASCLRLFGSMCIEQSEIWQSGRKYLDMSLIEDKKQEKIVELAQAG